MFSVWIQVTGRLHAGQPGELAEVGAAAKEGAFGAIGEPFGGRVVFQVDFHTTQGHALTHHLGGLHTLGRGGGAVAELKQRAIGHTGHTGSNTRGGRITIIIQPTNLIQQSAGSASTSKSQWVTSVAKSG